MAFTYMELGEAYVAAGRMDEYTELKQVLCQRFPNDPVMLKKVRDLETQAGDGRVLGVT